jgi:hypothetical protein
LALTSTSNSTSKQFFFNHRLEIQFLNPDRTVFICSAGAKGSVSQVTGEGTPCKIRQGAEVQTKSAANS